MRRSLLSIALAVLPLGALADSGAIVDAHVLPRFEVLAERSAELSDAAAADCTASSAPLRAAYGAAFDAWISASHLRFGPTEVADRGFALAFWPDSRGATPKALGRLIADEDEIAEDPEAYAQVSVAARGFYALEFLLYDDAFSAPGDYPCTLIQTVAADIAAVAAAIHTDWVEEYADRLRAPAPEGTYRSEAEALQELFKALTTGLQFTSETRLGRPLGTFDRPRPARAEARRSGRSAHHVALSLAALQDLAGRLASDDPALAADLEEAFARSMTLLAERDDPVFASVAAPQTRLKVEILQQSVDEIRAVVSTDLGPRLGVASGFNSLDGD
ncbi:MAG: imelysin family protein [Pseudomonadota bacterium]